MVAYQGRDIEFRYPDNWRVSEQGDTISVAPDNGFVSGSLAYGMTIARFQPTNDRFFGRNSFTVPGTRPDTNTLDNASNQLIDDLANFRVDAVRESRDIKIRITSEQYSPKTENF